ncbi:MAG: outer membrane protein assembly factor BamC [Ectothiorhodospiraceae bacterium]|nr:outer membrane protein assembly factor BamC [Ectothiorhodospiraceae bacterium]
MLMTHFFHQVSHQTLLKSLNYRSLSQALLTVLAALLLGACSWFGGDDPEPQDAMLLAPLEIPPNLISPQGDPRLARPTLLVISPSTGKFTRLNNKLAASPSVDCQCAEPARIGERVLPQGKGVQHMREGQRRWLIVQAEPEQVWPLARKFLEMRGYRILRDEPAIGFLETDWKPQYAGAGEKLATADNGQANWRERLNIRIEPAEKAGYSEIYVSQRHSQRVSQDSSESEGFHWELRPADNDRAVEMLNRLARYLAAEDVQDAVPLTPLTAGIEIDGEGHTVIKVKTTFDIAWRRTSVALENLGFTLEDHNRASRIFHVSNELPSGLSEEELNYGKAQSATVKEEYWLHVKESGADVNISVRNKAGNVDESRVARHVLNLLLGQLQ